MLALAPRSLILSLASPPHQKFVFMIADEPNQPALKLQDVSCLFQSSSLPPPPSLAIRSCACLAGLCTLMLSAPCILCAPFPLLAVSPPLAPSRTTSGASMHNLPSPNSPKTKQLEEWTSGFLPSTSLSFMLDSTHDSCDAPRPIPPLHSFKMSETAPPDYCSLVVPHLPFYLLRLQ